MAVLALPALAEIRQEVSRGVIVTWTKPTINAALQAVEDWFEANRASLGAAIEAAAPAAFTAAQKKKLVAYWLSYKFSQEK